MSRRLIIGIISCFSGSILIVMTLVAISQDIRERPGSFLRQYPPHPVIESKLIKLPNRHYYFAGATDSKVYLANSLNPLEILVINRNMSDTSVVELDIDMSNPLQYYRITTRIDSPYFYFMDGAVPYLYKGDVSNWQGRPFLLNDAYFIDAVPISSRSFAISAMSANTMKKVLGKMVGGEGAVELNYDILEPQFDGLFDVDGSLSYDRFMNVVVYVYYYRNQFMVMDSNLNLQYRGNTIDTFKTAQIKTAEISSQGSISLSSPPVVTNKSHSVSQNRLFIHSLLPARNEDMSQFDVSSVVDVYDLPTGSYQFSFHIFDEDGEKIKTFKVVGRNLYALFQHSIRQYDLTDLYFPRGEESKTFYRVESGMNSRTPAKK